MLSEDLAHSKILIVDDEPPNVALLEDILRRRGYDDILTATDARRVLPLLSAFEPDLILLDLHMPFLDGHEVLRQIRSRTPEEEYLPVLVLTGDNTGPAKQAALSHGAQDFLSKPCDPLEVCLRTENLLRTRWLHRRLRQHSQALEETVRQRTQDLEESRQQILERLALAAEFRDDATGAHTRRVGETSAALARGLGLPDDRVALIRRAAPLHDLGKIGIPDGILLKPGKLTPDEYRIMQTHTVIGAKIQSGSRVPLLQMAEEIALTHHERWDGSGYAGLAGELIPLSGRIVAVADVFDALLHRRPYKPAYALDRALTAIREGAGSHFDPRVVEAFVACREDIVRIQRGGET